MGRRGCGGVHREVWSPPPKAAQRCAAAALCAAQVCAPQAAERTGGNRWRPGTRCALCSAHTAARMSMYGSQRGLNMGRRASSKGDLNHHYARSEVYHGGGNGYDPYSDGYNTYSFSKSTLGGMPGGMSASMGGGMR